MHHRDSIESIAPSHHQTRDSFCSLRQTRADSHRRTGSTSPRWLTAALLTTALLSAACASTRINQVLADPSRYRDSDVRISGSVVDSFSIADRGAYRIGDDSGQLWVVSSRGVPRKGARVTVKGRIRQGFDLGSLGDLVNLPAGASGLVMVESSRQAAP
jgi:hypothetical protein